MEANRDAIFALDLDDKLQLVQDLWDDIATNGESIPVHEWQKVELDRRSASLDDPQPPRRRWDEFKRQLTEGHDA